MAFFMGPYGGILSIEIAGFWNTIPSLSRYRPALESRPVPDYFGIPAEGYLYQWFITPCYSMKQTRLFIWAWEAFCKGWGTSGQDPFLTAKLFMGLSWWLWANLSSTILILLNFSLLDGRSMDASFDFLIKNLKLLNFFKKFKGNKLISFYFYCGRDLCGLSFTCIF